MSFLNPFSWGKTDSVEPQPPSIPVIDDMPDASHTTGVTRGIRGANYDGEKFPGGLNPLKYYEIDFWELRERSRQLFIDNLYARGILRRIITNEINTGLVVESTPEEQVLGRELGSMGDWSENVENLFNLYAKSPQICDVRMMRALAKIQVNVKLEAMVYGDVLIVLRTDPITKLPQITLINAGAVQTPSGNMDNKIVHGVERNKNGVHVAFHVAQDDGRTTKRITAIDGKTGLLQAFLVYGNDMLEDDVRGTPLLALIVQSLSEIDKYRDSAQRQALIASMFVGYIKKSQELIGSLPIGSGAVKNSEVNVADDNGTNTTRRYKIADYLPGSFMEELQAGEEPFMFGGQGTDINFGEFEEVIVSTLAWVYELPPEILKLAFSNNYSASQAAINEYKSTLNVKRLDMQTQFLDKVYASWFYGSVITGKISAPGYLAALNNRAQYDIKAAWLSSDWTGAIKPSTDTLKQGKGMALYIQEGLITRDRASKETTGTKFSKNVKQLQRENQMLADAARPMLELQAEFGKDETEQAVARLSNDIEDITAVVEEIIEKQGDE